jgi:hypothetical protein
MYCGPGFGGWGMTFMIIGNLLFWALLIFVAIRVSPNVPSLSQGAAAESSRPGKWPDQVRRGQPNGSSG